MSIGALIFVEYTIDDSGKVIKPLSYYPIGEYGSFCAYEAGTEPKLKNEVVFSRKATEENDLEIGDIIYS